MANPRKCSPLVQIFQLQVWDLVLLEPCPAPSTAPRGAAPSEFVTPGLTECFSAFLLSWVRFVSQPDVLCPTLESPGAAPSDLIACRHSMTPLLLLWCDPRGPVVPRLSAALIARWAVCWALIRGPTICFP